MKIIKINLSEEQRAELRKLQRKSGDYRSERALAVLHCSEGMKATEIASLLKHRINTVCNWLNAFIKHGTDGLNRAYSKGRPSKRSLEFTPKLEEYLQKSPRDYGLGEMLWTIKVLQFQYKKDTGKNISQDSIRRALYDAGYSTKRPKKTIPSTAPSKEEKLEHVRGIIKELAELTSQTDVEVMFLDESHFSTEPYVIRGWSKKGKPFFPVDPEKTRNPHNIWGICTSKRFFLLEECKKR